MIFGGRTVFLALSARNEGDAEVVQREKRRERGKVRGRASE